MNNSYADFLTFPNEWDEFLKDIKEDTEFLNTLEQTAQLYLHEIIFPPKKMIYKALEYVNPKDVKVVIIGQDPYINEGQANGLAFSVNPGVKIPPSLRNIYKELSFEYQVEITRNGDLTSWAKQGVLLLNSSLVTKAGQAGSLCRLGWTRFTDFVIQKIDQLDRPVVYLLWGDYSRKKKDLIHSSRACIIETSHPSPLSARRGFLGSNCFKKCNQYLKDSGLSEIDFIEKN